MCQLAKKTKGARKKRKKGCENKMVQTISTKPTSWQRAPQHLEDILKGLQTSPEEGLT